MPAQLSTSQDLARIVKLAQSACMARCGHSLAPNTHSATGVCVTERVSNSLQLNLLGRHCALRINVALCTEVRQHVEMGQGVWSDIIGLLVVGCE